MRESTLKIAQHALMSVGLVLLAVCALALIDRSVSSRAALEAFDRAQAAASAADRRASHASKDADVDFTLWSEKRVRQYKDSLPVEKRLPLAVLEIGKLGVRVPVLEGTDDLALNRGAGWIAGTARPGTPGNIGIAAHRDGFFRGLKDITPGDAIELATLTERATYVVDQIEIVSPESVEVLQPRAVPSLTLVTCYPFYFVGDAPQRFIVHARLDRTTTTKPLETARR